MSEFLDKSGFSRAMQSVDARVTAIVVSPLNSILTIGENGNWFIDDIDTGIKAQGNKGDKGEPGSAPTIGANGNWFINNVDTGTKAQGNKGDKGEPGSGGGEGTTINRVVAVPDWKPAGFLSNKDIVLLDTSPVQYGVVKCRHDCACRPQLISWKTMDEKLVATLKQRTHLFVPIVFPEKMPPRTELFDRLTFINNDKQE